MIEVAKQIEEKIKELNLAKTHLAKRGEAKAVTSAEYDKAITITIIKLRNGEVMKLEEETITDPPATLIDKIARGICWKERLAMDKSEAEYKSIITFISVVESQLNAYQSLFRHME